MTLLAALISLFTALTGSFQPLRGYEDSLREDPILQQIGGEQEQMNPGQMARAGMGLSLIHI